jgi:ABC-type dipeptide/oligopeptide/nickel transport system permease subunit
MEPGLLLPELLLLVLLLLLLQQFLFNSVLAASVAKVPFSSDHARSMHLQPSREYGQGSSMV